MNEDVLNTSIRRFLKTVGVTSQREIEKAVEAALKRGALSGDEVLPVRATLAIPNVLPEIHIDGEIALSGSVPPDAA